MDPSRGARGDLVEKAVARLPKQGLRCVFAYGSGVFAQKGDEAGPPPLVDLIVAVEGSDAWHAANMERHPKHYSGLALAAGARTVAKVQRAGPAAMYFNTDVLLGELRVKYGVIEVSDLHRDLHGWNALYVSGRLHKPVRFLRLGAGDGELRSALQSNLASALHAALLLLPERFDEVQLFTAVCGLSYAGDVRMALAENPRKVHNIVEANADAFAALYEPFLVEGAEPFFGRVKRAVSGAGLVQDVGLGSRKRLWEALPDGLGLRGKPFAQDTSASELQSALRRVVGRSSRIQSAKGLLTAGPLTAAAYALRKVAKRFAPGLVK